MKQFILICISVFFAGNISAQNDTTATAFQSVIPATNISKTNNSKDIHNNFLQASINNIFGPKNSFSINPSLYAIDSLLYHKPRNPNSSLFSFCKKTL